MKKIISILLVISLMLILVFSFPVSADTKDVTFRPFEGDINLDTILNAADALMILQHSVGLLSLDTQQEAVADMDGNEAINASDALLVLQTSVGIYNPLRVVTVTEKTSSDSSGLRPAFPLQPKPDPVERIEYDSIEALIEAVLNGAVLIDRLWIPSSTAGDVAVTSVWSQGDDYGYTVTRDDRSFAFALDPTGKSPQQAINSLFSFQDTMGGLPILFWADWEETNALVTLDLGPTAAFSVGQVSVMVEGDQAIDSVFLFSDAGQKEGQQALFAWLDWFEFSLVTE